MFPSFTFLLRNLACTHEQLSANRTSMKSQGTIRRLLQTCTIAVVDFTPEMSVFSCGQKGKPNIKN